MKLSRSKLSDASFSILLLAILSLIGSRAYGQDLLPTENILWNFANGNDGAGPASGLVKDSNGNFYGTTTYGGAYRNEGTLFEMSPPTASGGTWTESILWNFGNGTDGAYPLDIISDSNGNLFGTTQYGGTFGQQLQSGNNFFPNMGGTVFELTPPASPDGSWAESVLWNFGAGADGVQASSGLIMDRNGNLYGTTTGGGVYLGKLGGGGGTVYELTPSPKPGGIWTESVLWSFGNGGDGELPGGNLVMDKRGNLFGTTFAGGPYANANGVTGGTVFELTPPSEPGGGWTESVLWNFGNGRDGAYPTGIAIDAAGNLFGTTAEGGAYPGQFGVGNGTVFELTPPSSAGESWHESILWNFGDRTDGAEPIRGLKIDASGNLYGTDAGGGAYSSASEGIGGTLFELAPSPISKGIWNEFLLWNFGNGYDSADPNVPFLEAGGLFYATAHLGGTYGFIGNVPSGGTMFELANPIFAPTRMTASRTNLKFGNVDATGKSSPRRVVLDNKGTGPARLSWVTASAPFIIGGGPDTCSNQTIAARARCSFNVQFAPSIPGKVTDGAVNFGYNGTPPAIALGGTAVAVNLKGPKHASFPAVPAGGAGKIKNLVFSNPSKVSVMLGPALLGGTNPDSFPIFVNECAPFLDAKAKCKVGLKFAPPDHANGQHSATLSFAYTYGPNHGVVSTSLTSKVK